jgi:hypothetical protein
LPVITPSCKRMGFDTSAAAAPECWTVVTLRLAVPRNSDIWHLFHCYSPKILWMPLSLVCAGKLAASVLSNLPLRWRVARFTDMFSGFHSGCC